MTALHPPYAGIPEFHQDETIVLDGHLMPEIHRSRSGATDWRHYQNSAAALDSYQDPATNLNLNGTAVPHFRTFVDSTMEEHRLQGIVSNNHHV